MSNIKIEIKNIESETKNSDILVLNMDTNKPNRTNKIKFKINKKKNTTITTFKNLYEFLQLYEENNIQTWLEEPWIGKDKQE